MQEGFRIRYERREHVLGPVWKNMKTAVENPQVISEYLDVERKRGALLGPFEWSEVPEFHLSHSGHSQVGPARKMEVDCRPVPRGEKC